jgi:hypothetical protein
MRQPDVCMSLCFMPSLSSRRGLHEIQVSQLLGHIILDVFRVFLPPSTSARRPRSLATLGTMGAARSAHLDHIRKTSASYFSAAAFKIYFLQPHSLTYNVVGKCRSYIRILLDMAMPLWCPMLRSLI